MKIKVLEQFVFDALPEILILPGEERVFTVLRQTDGRNEKTTGGRYLVHLLKGGYSLDHILPSWWVDKNHCDVIEENPPVPMETIDVNKIFKIIPV